MNRRMSATELSLVRQLKFCAGHRLYKHESKCAFFHGHNYRVDIEVVGKEGGTEVDAVGRVVDFEVEGGGEEMGKSFKVVCTETAADAERREGGIGEDDALAGAALEFEDEFGERRAAEAQERGLPGEGAGNFVGGGGGHDDRGGRWGDE